MIKILEKSKCSGCHACVGVCPKSCITMQRDEDGFLYPVIDESACVDCKLCERVCPIINKKENRKQIEDIGAYAAYTKDDKLRFNSSSGGIFTEIASTVIEDGGVVFGAAFTENFDVAHKCIDTVEGLRELRGSKYVQSTIGNTFSLAKQYLQEGRKVLFTGTPCQIAGLYSYLGKEYDNLITQDIICHGVPSPMLWKKYIELREDKSGARIQGVSFRHKKTGWKTYSIHLVFANNKEYIASTSEDYYMRGFLSNLCLRPSCYDCKFKDKIRQSDITLADFWGIQHVLPEMNDNKGTSLVIVNSKVGRELIERISDKITVKSANLEEAMKHNTAMISSAFCPSDRESYMETVRTKGIKKATKKYLKVRFVLRAKRWLHRFLKK